MSLLCIASSIAYGNSDFKDLATYAPEIKLDIRYATTNNLTHKKVYPAARCFVRAEVAERLKEAAAELKELGLGITVFDGYRPLAVQRIFWNLMPDERYVADPEKGSRHNRGAAVDLTLHDLSTGENIEMPSEFDDLSERAHRDYVGITTRSIIAARNSKLLELIMEKHGFIGLPTEWWHYDHVDWEQYGIMDVSFDELDSQASEDCVCDERCVESDDAASDDILCVLDDDEE